MEETKDEKTHNTPKKSIKLKKKKQEHTKHTDEK